MVNTTVWRNIEAARSVGPSRWLVECVPYNTITHNRPNAGGEKVARGAFQHLVAGQPTYALTARHDGPAVGSVSGWVEHAGGLRATVTIHNTTNGQVAGHLLNSGRAEFSIGWRTVRDHYEGKVRVIDLAELDHVALLGADLGPAAYPTKVLEAAAAAASGNLQTSQPNGWRSHGNTMWRPIR